MFLSILATAGLSLLLYVSGFFVVMTPLPFALTGLKRGRLAVVLSFVLSLLVLAILYRISSSPLPFLPMAPFYEQLGSQQTMALSLITFFYYGWMGFVLTVVARRSGSIERSFIELLIAIIVVPALLLIWISNGFGLHPVSEIRSGLQFLIGQTILLQQKSGTEGEETLFLKQHAPGIVTQIIHLLPALWINLTIVMTSLNILFIRRWASSEHPFPGWAEFSLWRLGERWVWIPIATGSLYFMNHYLIHRPLFEVIFLNGLLVLAVVYFFQGLSIVSFYFRRKLSPWMRMLAYFLVILFLQMIGIVIVALGLFDFWFDFRKLKKVGG